MHNTIIFVAGRSGGHILPCISLAQDYKQQASRHTIFITTTTSLDKKIIADHPWIDTHYAYTLDNFPGKKIWRYPVFITQFLFSFLKSFWLIYKTKPTKIISSGGYIAIPVCFAAKFCDVPIELYELNVIPGKAIKLLGPYATTMYICFSQTQKYLPKRSCKLVNYPIKPQLKKNFLSQNQALATLNLSPNKKTILILGGSQGSLFLNKLMQEYAPTAHDIQIIHQTGNDSSVDWQQWYAHHNVPAYVFDFDKAIENYYAAADLVICRAGAGTLFELVHLHKKAITIPLQTASTHHQKYNALALAEQHPNLITVLEQKEIENDPTVFATTVQSIIQTRSS